MSPTGPFDRRKALRVRAPLALAAALALAAPMAETPWTAALAEARAEALPDPRTGQPDYERTQRLFDALREILDEAARERLAQQTAPDGALSDFVFRQFGVDRSSRVRDLLGSAFEMMTDAPIVAMRERIGEAQGEIAAMRGQIAELREQRIAAPRDGGWSSWLGLSDDYDSITETIEELERRIQGQEESIAEAKREFSEAMAAAGAPISDDQVDLLLDSVTGADLVEMAAAYEAVRGVSEQLRQLMDENGEDLTYAKRYYGMHTALIALLVEAQNQFLDQIDGEYMPKLKAIEDDIRAAARETERLLEDRPTRDQREALLANQRSQRVAWDALSLYRDYLMRQRGQIESARERALRELRVADNTLRTVDASFQLRQVMESAAGSFDALSTIESPGFERLFRNEQLRREFQELTERLGPNS